jgi:phosphate starvation-inducible PhoH-like protein
LDVRPLSQSAEPATLQLDFDDNRLLPLLFGAHDKHLAQIEQRLGVSLTSRGNQLIINGPADSAELARRAMLRLYRRVKAGEPVDPAEVDAALRMADAGEQGTLGDEPAIKTRKKRVSPRSPAQRRYIEAMQRNELVLGLGPAGTGKTYLAVCFAVEMLITGRVDRLILSRPAVEAGERLGFLPGDMREKVDPYLRPLYDALYDTLPADQVMKKLETGEIEIAPLAFMRGRTLSNAFVILDEAQNTTPVQMKMFLTRLGENSRMVVTGDLSQVDLPKGVTSGLRDATDTLDGLESVSFVRFTERDVVRHSLVARIVGAYERRSRSGTPNDGK